MLKKLIMIFVMVGALLCIGPIQAYALSVEFDPDPINVTDGDSFTVDLLADIAQDEEILGWDIDLLFDDTQVSFLGWTVGSSWNMVSPVPDDDVSIAAMAPFGLPPGTGISGTDVVLATLSFDCIAVGTSSLNIGVDDALFEGFQLAATPGFATWTSNAAPVNQAPVPEPCTMLLMGTGLVGMGLFGRKKLKK